MIRFDHVNIRVSDQEAVRDFLVATVGLSVGPRPGFAFPGYWLYLDGEPVVHLAPRDAPGETGWVNHIAFTGFDFAAKTAALGRAGLSHRVQVQPDTGVRQIFVDGPEGLRVELQCPPQEPAHA